MTTQVSQALPEANRRVRTSAAMIGLAVSMGAYGVPIHHQGDRALAADTPTGEPLSSDVSASFETAKAELGLSPVAAESQPSQIKHTVQEGQTLWDVARFYKIDAAAIAEVNRLSLNAVLTVGQVLIVPTDARIAQAPGSVNGAASLSSASMPSYYGPVAGRATLPQAVEPQTVAALPEARLNATLKTKQDAAVDVLKEKRETLRSSLTALRNQAPAPTASAPNFSNQSEQVAPAIAPVKGTQPQPLPSVLASTDQAQAIPQPLPATRSNASANSQVVDAEPEVALRLAPQDETTAQARHRVGPGDTLASIARLHGVSLNQLVAANQISDPNYIFVNQVLVIPQAYTAGAHIGGAADRPFTGAIAAVPMPAAVDVSTAPKDTKSFAAVQSNSVESTKVAAKTPFVANPQQVAAIDSSPNLLRYNQIENLKLEIDQLREKYHGEAAPAKSVVLSTPKASATPGVVVEPVNPEFNPAKYARVSGIRQRIRENAPAQRDRGTPANQVVKTESQVVAVAPLGSANYAPIQSKLGQTVSPDMPPLGSGSEYLPGAPGQFNGYIWPAKGVLTSPYGWRWGRMHKGIDIAGPVGTPIVAAADGRITYAGWNSGGYGYLVEIEHTDGSLTLYAHNSRVLVQVGQEVAQGQQVAEMGSTGYSTGPHLHFEVHPSGKGATNPMAFLPKR